MEDPPLSSVIYEPGLERHQVWDYLTASCLWKDMDVWQVVIISCWNNNGWKYASVLIHCIIYRLALWAKVNTQQLSHLDLNFSLLLWNFTLCSHEIYHHCCVYSVCCVPRINLQFWFFTLNATSVTNGSFYTQHYSFAEEWLEEHSEAKGSDASPIFWFAFIQKCFHWFSSTYRTIVVWELCMN